jgi:hypothetical protein
MVCASSPTAMAAVTAVDQQALRSPCIMRASGVSTVLGALTSRISMKSGPARAWLAQPASSEDQHRFIDTPHHRLKNVSLPD